MTTHRRFVLGLLGGIASGKSTVARTLAATGRATRLDADALAREALDACARDGRLVEGLGPWAVGPDGKPDRKAIAAHVFDDPVALRNLERLIHPAVHARIASALDGHRAGEGPALLVLDVPLLVESGLDRRCDALWFIEAPEAQRMSRAKERLGLEAEAVRKREAAQTALARKKARADLVLVNDGTTAELERKVLEALNAAGF